MDACRQKNTRRNRLPIPITAGRAVWDGGQLGYFDPILSDWHGAEKEAAT